MNPELNLTNNNNKNNQENHSKERIPRGKILIFEHQPHENVYNPSRPFIINGEKYILARVEDTRTNSSKVYPFVFKNGIWQRKDWHLSQFEFEDPQITTINNNLLLVVVRVLDKTDPDNWIIRSEFYFGPNLDNLKKITEGPIGMKDIRLIEFEGKIGVFLRPKVGRDKRGRISYLEINNLDELQVINQNTGRMIQLPISDNEWVGTNDVYYLGNGILGVLAHKGDQDQEGNLHYCAIAFKFNPQDFSIYDYQIIAQSNDFPLSVSKSPRYEDVIFPGGFERFHRDNKELELYTGLRDAEVGCILIKNPYL
jgi:hypothetical protein